MLIPAGLADSVAEIAADLPEAALRQIILALAPRAPVATREPTMAAPTRKLKTRAPRATTGRFQRGPQLSKSHRPGTWRYAMTTACRRALASSDAACAACAEAQRILEKDFPDFANRRIEWSFLTEREYVTIN
jgi:hypothetical protein